MEHGPRSLEAAIGRFAEALEAGRVAPAVEAFGARRGDDGIALADALDDLDAVHRAVAGVEPPGSLLRGFAVAWSESAHGRFLARGALDHRTGLATTDFLATRLRDLARTGEHRRRRLVVAAPAPATASQLRGTLRGARIARILLDSFPLGETPAGLPSGRIALIAPLDDAFEADLVRARIAIRAIDGEDAAVEHLGLPATAAAIPELLATL